MTDIEIKKPTLEHVFLQIARGHSMSFHRIRAILLHDYFIMTHSFEVLNDLFLYPLWSIMVFGFMTLYISGTSGADWSQARSFWA
jgi:hypothetical protein